MDVRHLAPGTYDFVVLNGKTLALGLSAPEQARGGGPLTPEVEKALRDRASEIQNFFTSKEIVLLNGTDRASRALVKMVRTEKSSFDGKGGRQRFFRFEIWTLVKVGDRWLVDSRTFVTRGKDPIGTETFSEPIVIRVASLEGLEVGEKKTEAETTLDLEAEGDHRSQ